MRVERREVALHDGRVRYHVTVTDDNTDEGERALWRRWDFLRLLADTPHLLACGPVQFEQLTVRHDGTRWVAMAEATAAKQQAWIT